MIENIEIGSEWIWTNKDGEVEVWVIDVATDEYGETLITTEEADGEIQYDDIDYFLANYKPKKRTISVDKQEMKLMDWVDLGAGR